MDCCILVVDLYLLRCSELTQNQEAIVSLESFLEVRVSALF